MSCQYTYPCQTCYQPCQQVIQCVQPPSVIYNQCREKGQKGDPGTNGTNGSKGQQGDKGLQIKGQQGTKGETGAIDTLSDQFFVFFLFSSVSPGYTPVPVATQINLRKTGDVVTFQIFGINAIVTGGATARTFVSQAPLPAAYIPNIFIRAVIQINDGGNIQYGMLTIDSTGYITIGTSDGNPLPGSYLGGTAQFYGGLDFSYIIA